MHTACISPLQPVQHSILIEYLLKENSIFLQISYISSSLETLKIMGLIIKLDR